jgi:hypothetical protein
MKGLLAPAERAPAIVLIPLVAVHRHAKLESQLFVVRDVRLVHEVDIRDSNGWQRHGAHGARRRVEVGLFDGLPLDRYLEDGDLSALLVHLAPESTRHESMAIRVDEITRNVFPQRHARRPR